jgi:effector-binding domain-containing protein
MSYNCTVTDRWAQPALSIRTRTPVQDLPQVVGKAYAAIGQYLGELGESPVGAPFAAYYNMDMQDLDVELGFPLAASLPGRGEIRAAEIPGGKVATCLHIGPYSELAPAYEALTKYTAEQGYEASGIVYEFYLNDPTQVPAQELQTEIVFLLKSE